jgi:hypothetical protein
MMSIRATCGSSRLHTSGTGRVLGLCPHLERGAPKACLALGGGELDSLRAIAVAGLFAASFIGSSGCSGHAPYPKTWPQLRQAPRQSCQRVAGTYWNEGERGQMEHYGPAYLIEMIPGSGSSEIVAFNKPRRAAKETVTLSFPLPDQLDVVIAGSEPVPRRLSLSHKAGQFKCDGSTLVVTTNTRAWTTGAAGFPAAGGESVVMKVDLIEGCLILTRRHKDYMWLPFPGWSTWSSWYRFCAVPSDAAPGSGR